MYVPDASSKLLLAYIEAKSISQPSGPSLMQKTNLEFHALKALFETYHARDDLRTTFPEADGGNLYGLLRWAVNYGTTTDSSKSLLEPYRKQFLQLLDETREQKTYNFATYLGHRFECTYMIDVGCDRPTDLTRLSSQFQIIGIGRGTKLQLCENSVKNGIWMERDLDTSETITIPENILQQSIIVCVKDLFNHSQFLNNLKTWLNWAPICVLSTPRADRSNMGDDHDLAKSSDQLDELRTVELERFLRSKGFNVAFIGLKINDGRNRVTNGIIAVIQKNSLANDTPNVSAKHVPPDFRVVAIMKTYNEEDIIVPSMRYLIEQGIFVYIVDNWSTDSTYNLAKQFEGRGLIGIERFPNEGPPKYYDLLHLLRRIETLTKEIEGDWFINNDVDEIRTSPWPGISLREGIHIVDRAGFNCIDNTVVEFPPIDNKFRPGSDFETHFKYFRFGRHAAYLFEIKTWKKFGQSISLTESAGHEVSFKGRRIFPYKFLLKHYPIRSQKHGEKKILVERKPRYHPERRAIGWHNHYDNIREGHVFLNDPSELELFDEKRFNRRYLIERLSGVDIL